jgi:hypothetical protein
MAEKTGRGAAAAQGAARKEQPLEQALVPLLGLVFLVQRLVQALEPWVGLYLVVMRLLHFARKNWQS